MRLTPRTNDDTDEQTTALGASGGPNSTSQADRFGVSRWDWERALDADFCTLSRQARLVGLVVATFADGDTGHGAYPSQKAIGKRAGISDRSVREILADLRDSGWLARTFVAARQGGRSDKADGYRLTVPILDSTGNPLPVHNPRSAGRPFPVLGR